MSAMSYGARGKNVIQAISKGLGRVGGTWMNTGEGGLSPHHLVGGAPEVVGFEPGLVEADDAMRSFGVRDRVTVTGKLFSADRIALALCLGADAVQIARGFMISVGCIQAQKCHNNTCPVGIATTDEKLMKALVVDEKQFRVANYVTTLRAGLASLTAASGLRWPREFTRRHAVYRNAAGQATAGDVIFPYPETGTTPPPAG